MQLIVHGVVPSNLGYYTSAWRAITYAQISNEVLGMVKGEVNQGHLECKTNVLTSEFLHTTT
jgi:hypothetical protein